MAGLFDALESDQGLLGLALLQAASPKPVRTGLGEGLLGGLQLVQQQRNQREDRAQRQRMQQLQEQALLAQLDERKRAAEAQVRRGQYLGALDANQGPPMQMTPAGALAAGLSPQEMSILAPQLAKAPEFKVVGGSLVKIGPDGVSEAYRAPEKPESAPSSVREYQFAVSQGFKGSFDQWDQARRRAGAPSVSVPINMGQKGFDNTLKLRGDFRGEPVYKAHQEMQSAYSQIQQSLKQASPAGDLAGATKIMKLLDPGSVVRESELGMAMAASGLMDRVVNYADNVIKGTKLTPTQRADFQRLADALFSESVKQYNAKRTEYQGIAERNQLNVQDVLGAESAAPVATPGSAATATPGGLPTAEAIAAELARRAAGGK